MIDFYILLYNLCIFSEQVTIVTIQGQFLTVKIEPYKGFK